MINKSLKLAEAIKVYIKEKALKEGDKLPPIAQFAKIFSAGKDSINEAMEILSYEGIVTIKQRHGVYISHNMWNHLYPMTPEWHDFTHKSFQKLNSLEVMSAHDHKEVRRWISTPYVNSTFFPEIVNSGLKAAGKFSADENSDILFGDYDYAPLKNRLCEYMARYGLIVTPDRVFIMNGIVEALTAVCLSTMSKGLELIREEPVWFPAHKRLASYGINIKCAQMDEEGIIKNELIKLLKSPAKKMLCTLPSHSNPTGTVMSLKRREEVLKICQNLKVPIIEIDQTREIVKNLPPPLAALDKSDSVIYIGTIEHNLPFGTSLYWIVSPDAIKDRFRHYKIQSDYTSRLTQLFFYGLLESGEFYKYNDMFGEFLKKRNEFTHDVLTKYLGSKATWKKDGHPLLFWVKFNDDVDMEKLYAINEFLTYRGAMFGIKYSRHTIISSLNMEEDVFISYINKIKEVIG